MSTRYFFVEPIDVLMLRGNRSFGDAGQHGEALMPPWPSVFAGAFRSALLADDAKRLAVFVAVGSGHFASESERAERMRDVLGEARFAVLGTPQQPGSFRITWASLALAASDTAWPQAVLPLPADLLVADEPAASPMALLPTALPPGTSGASTLPMVALLRSRKQVKPAGGHWLDGEGLAAHVRGQLVPSTLRTAAVYKTETRLGIALNAASRTASDGAIYTTEAVAFGKHAGFIIGVQGAGDLLRAQGMLRLGGDGKGARYREVPFDLPATAGPRDGGRFRLLLTTPAGFSGGWLPTGVVPEGAQLRLRGAGFSARLACAALGRHEVVSGWDLAQWRPKAAQRAAPSGSVYWFDEFEGDSGKLAAWVAGGLWPENGAMSAEQRQRRAEGLNNALLGHWL